MIISRFRPSYGVKCVEKCLKVVGNHSQFLSCLCRLERLVHRSFSCTGSEVPYVHKPAEKLSDDASDYRGDIEAAFRKLMRIVPHPVVVVTSAEYQEANQKWYKRGITCTSFNSVSSSPPIISFCIQNPSRMHDLLLRTERFAVHVLARDQIKHGLLFSKPPTGDQCQFQSVEHEQDEKGLPIITGSCAVIQCKAHSVSDIGDHHVWYGDVLNTTTSSMALQPLLYHVRSFRSVGDEIFLQAFEDATLPFEEWTHEAHLRMAWNYIQEYGRDGALPHIRSGIQKYNEQNIDKIKVGYHETITVFFLHAISDAMRNSTITTFEEFLQNNKHLTNKDFLFQYYKQSTIASEEAKKSFIPPDHKPLPGLE